MWHEQLPIQINNQCGVSFLFIDQELQKLRSGMKSLVAANDEKVSYPWSGNLSILFLVNTSVRDYAI